jgi:hypothetical protein
MLKLMQRSLRRWCMSIIMSIEKGKGEGGKGKGQRVMEIFI